MAAWRHWLTGVVPCVLLLALIGCAPRLLTLPTGPGAPFPDFALVHDQISAACRGVRTMTAELSLSGQAGGQRLRTIRVHAGFAAPGAMRLEGVAGFGQRVFILAAGDGEATLLLTRERRVVRDASVEEILGALTGVALPPEALQAILTGCVAEAPRAVAGALHGGGWAAIALDGGATMYLQRRGPAWELRAARRAGWHIEFPAWQGRFPQVVRLRSVNPGPVVDLTATLAQLEINAGIDPAAFSIEVPPDARPLSVDELRDAGPLQGT